jgi:hypothetical protein
MTPLISAETGDGAAGCASGSHACSGKRPAFAPNPNNASRYATVIHPAEAGSTARIVAKV